MEGGPEYEDAGEPVLIDPRRGIELSGGSPPRLARAGPENLNEGDVILKGANALDLTHRQAAVFIGHPKGDTIGASLQAVVGRRVRMILPVGLEMWVYCDLMELATGMTSPGTNGPRLLPVPGEVFTEIDAISLMTGTKAELIVGGGVGGAEGSIWLTLVGNDGQMARAEELMKAISSEPMFEI